MAKGSRQRAMPRTPGQSTSPRQATPPTQASDAPGDGGVPSGARPVPARPQAARPPGPAEPEYLLKGTGCTEGHERGHELDSGRLGTLPTRRATRIGVGLVLWCGVGVALLVDAKWLFFGLQMLVLWLAFSAVIQRRAGHKGRCWRTRAWRHAWGGFAPTLKDPTRPAGA
jgi:hypothetical protein